MGKVIDFKLLKLVREIAKMDKDELLQTLSDDKLPDSFREILSDEDMETLRQCDSISSKAHKQIEKYVVKKHGQLSDANPPTIERRDLFYQLSVNVATNLMGRALAFYDDAERESIMQNFVNVVLMQAAVLSGNYVDTDDENPDM